MKLARIYCKYSGFGYFLTLLAVLLQIRLRFIWGIHPCNDHGSSQRKLSVIPQNHLLNLTTTMLDRYSYYSHLPDKEERHRMGT